MSSLVDLPELVGFFSYSRSDDEHSGGALSRLRAHIHNELRLQIGRDVRLWQDTAAIPHGTLWENEIKSAIAQSTFFIPIVTPSAVASPHCKFEFESFLERELKIFRGDLVFPILYIRVPALEIEHQWRQNDVLKIIHARQYADWTKIRQDDVASPGVGKQIEHFCEDIVEALLKPWLSPEERRKKEAVEIQERAEHERIAVAAKAKEGAERERERQEAETERRAQEADAKRRADEQERRRQAEAETRQRAEDERRRQDNDAKQRAEEENAFKAAKREDRAVAVVKFLDAYPDSYLIDEARALRAVLLAREEAHHQAMECNDSAVLRAFLHTYPKGTPADEVRRRLQRLEPSKVRRLSQRAVAIGGLMGAAALGAIGAWLVIASPLTHGSVVVSPNPQISQLTDLLAMEKSRKVLLEDELVRMRSSLANAENERDRLKSGAAVLRAGPTDTQGKVTELSTTLDTRALAQVEILNQQIAALRRQLAALEGALDVSEKRNKESLAKVADLGQRLNVALAQRVQELSRYRSEFFGRLREILGNRPDNRVVGDRFVFQSDVFFDAGQAVLRPEGRGEIDKLVSALSELERQIPTDIAWVMRVDGHTDVRPIASAQFPSNWMLSSARAISVVQYLISKGLSPQHLVAAGFGEFQPIDTEKSEDAYRRNRRIELKLTER